MFSKALSFYLVSHASWIDFSSSLCCEISMNMLFQEGVILFNISFRYSNRLNMHILKWLIKQFEWVTSFNW
jgi:hypothetical protein